MNKRIAQYYTRCVDFALCFIQDENKRSFVYETWIKYFLSQYNNGFEDIKIHTFDKVLRIQCSAPSLFRQGVEEDKMQPAA